MSHELTYASHLVDALRRIYDRPQPPVPWRDGANLPWGDPAFSERMLAQSLDQTHGAASRPLREIRAQVQRMTAWLGLAPGGRLLDVTCEPGLYAAEFARRGLRPGRDRSRPDMVHAARATREW